MKKWQCPYAERPFGVDFLICKLAKKDNVNYQERKNAAQAFCAYQYNCPCTHHAENTDGAKKCYEYHST